MPNQISEFRKVNKDFNLKLTNTKNLKNARFPTSIMVWMRLVVSGVLGQPIGPTFKGQVLEDLTNMLSQNVGN
jgi:hypothetical protein